MLKELAEGFSGRPSPVCRTGRQVVSGREAINVVGTVPCAESVARPHLPSPHRGLCGPLFGSAFATPGAWDERDSQAGRPECGRHCPLCGVCRATTSAISAQGTVRTTLWVGLRHSGAWDDRESQAGRPECGWYCPLCGVCRVATSAISAQGTVRTTLRVGLRHSGAWDERESRAGEGRGKSEK